MQKSRPNLFTISAVLFLTLACRAATSLILPDTPVPIPTATFTPVATQTPTPPATVTPNPVLVAACPNLLEEIMAAAAYEDDLATNRNDGIFSLNDRNSIFLTGYDIDNDKLAAPYHVPGVPEGLKDEQKDRVTHEAIWNYFADIIPREEHNFVSEFTIFTDGRYNYLAAVSQTFSNSRSWALHVDIADSENYHSLTYTLIHEHGHLLTLNSKQVPPNKAVFDNPDDEDIYQREMAACSQYFTGEGCSKPDSYIHQFFTRFWSDFWAEWQSIDQEEDKDSRYFQLREFYRTYQDQFLTEYAATGPLEDIAESWTFFILSPPPEIGSIANEKIQFFYEYPELVELRTEILNRVCAEFPRSP